MAYSPTPRSLTGFIGDGSRKAITMSTSFLFERNSRFKVLGFVITLMAMFHVAPVYAQKSSLKTYKNPSVEVMRLYGDISCVKIYVARWETKFGERVDGEPELKYVLYFDSGHRLVCYEQYGGLADIIYDYKYEYDANGNLTSIDCYKTGGYPPLEWKMKLVNENGVVVAHKYNGYGDEVDKLKPYNAISGILSNYFNLKSDECVFAFEMIPKDLSAKQNFLSPSYTGRYTFADEKNKSKVKASYYYKYNNNNQLVKMYSPNPALAVGELNANFCYDDNGNLTIIDFYSSTPTGTGNKWTFEYTYGDFEETAKHSMEGREAEKQKQKERERAIRDSIKVAKAKEKELERIKRDSIAKAWEKEAELQRIMQDSIQKAKQQEYMEKQKAAEKKAKKERIKRRVGSIFKSILGNCRKEEFDVEDYLNKEVACLEQIYLKDGKGVARSKYFNSSGGVVIFDTDYGDMQPLGLG